MSAFPVGKGMCKPLLDRCIVPKKGNAKAHIPMKTAFALATKRK